jgi:hypothetical protein
MLSLRTSLRAPLIFVSLVPPRKNEISLHRPFPFLTSKKRSLRSYTYEYEETNPFPTGLHVGPGNWVRRSVVF